MRICLYTETALPKIGGQELVVDALAREFLALGHDVVVMTQPPRRSLALEDGLFPYPVVRHPRFLSTRRLVGWYRHWLIRLHRRERFDVVHCHSVYPCGYLAALSRKQLGVPYVVTSHGGDVREGNGRYERKGIRDRLVQAIAGADALVAISRFTAEGYRRLCPAAERIVEIPNGVDLQRLAVPAMRPGHFDPQLKAGKFILFLGRLNRRKGVDLLLEAMSLLPQGPASLPLVVAGDGEERPALAEQAARLGIADRVHFVGQVGGAAKSWLLQSAYCLAMPSRGWEAFPLVILEAGAVGRATIAARIPGLEDFVEPGVTGRLVPPESPAELAKALAETLADPARTQAMGANALAAARNFSWQNVALKHLRLYEELRSPGSADRAA